MLLSRGTGQATRRGRAGAGQQQVAAAIRPHEIPISPDTDVSALRRRSSGLLQDPPWPALLATRGLRRAGRAGLAALPPPRGSSIAPHPALGTPGGSGTAGSGLLLQEPGALSAAVSQCCYLKSLNGHKTTAPLSHCPAGPQPEQGPLA